ncbi:MAG: outer membrane protein transport protein [Gammaproteobacteria bacterium]|nr:outer membrane protein transport protein [Gammaproteobacteria bacterium]
MAGSAISAGTAQGAGFALIEVNATGQGNAYAGAAAWTNNASTIYFNPAGLTYLGGEQVVFAAHYIDPSSDFENKGSTLAPALGGGTLIGFDDDGGQSAFVPNFYWARPLDENLTFGIGVNSPFGLAIEYDDGWVGRYHALLSDLATVNFNPSLGYRVNDRVSIGGGINIMLADVELTSAVDMGAACLALAAGLCGPAGVTGGTYNTDGEAELEGDNFDTLAFGFNLGLMFEVSDRTRVGVSYRSEIDIEVDGDADFTLPAATDPASTAVNGFISASPLFKNTGLEAEVTLPASFSVSVAHQVDKFIWLADVTWTGWQSFDELRIEYDNPAQPDSVTTEDWDDSMRYSLGFEYQYSDTLQLRAGIALDETPVPSAERRTPRLPGDERTWYSVGLTKVVSKAMSFDLAMSFLDVDDARIDNEFESSLPTLQHTLTGEYEAEVYIVSAQLNWELD